MWRQQLIAGLLLIGAFGATLAHVMPPAAHPTVPTPSDESVNAVIETLNADLQQHWDQRQLVPTPPADRLTVARRLSLAMIGSIPSLEDQQQLATFSNDEAAIRWWCETLLQDRRYADYQAERFARVLVGVEEGPFLIFRRRRFVSWLSDQFHQQVPYDKLVADLITQDGLWTDTPAVNFLTVTTSDDNEGRPDPVRLAGRTSRAFLGVRLDCMQCHDDNLNGEWLQSDFHQLAAFYAEASPSLIGIVDRPREYEYQYLDADQPEVVPPGVPFHPELWEDLPVRRQQLARWVTHKQNGPFARAAVNRIWGLAFGRPLVEPVDNISIDGPFPPGMTTLAEDFAANGFDLGRLWRIIALSEPFRRASVADFEITAEHDKSYAAFPLTRLRPEQIAGAILQSSRLTTVDANSHILIRLGQYEQLTQFARRYGDTGEDELGAHGGTIPQRLLLMNGNLVNQRTKPDLVTNAASRIAGLAASPGAAIEAAYRTVLVRDPTERERTHFADQFAADLSRSMEQKMEDLCWVLFNSTEFSWNH